MKIAFVPVVRTLFAGSRLGLENQMANALGRLQKDYQFELYVGDVVSTREQASEAAQKLERLSPDLVILGVITFAGGEVFGPLLEVDVPKVLWALPETWSDGPLPQNALCGLNLALSLPALKAPAKWWFGPPEEGAVQAYLDGVLRALKGVKALRKARLLWLGGPAPGFDAFSERPTTGARVDHNELDALFEAFDSLSLQRMEVPGLEDPTWNALPKDIAEKFTRLAVAISMLSEGYDGVALRDWPEIPERLGVFPSAVLARLSELGVTVAPEGDLPGLLSQIVLQAVSGGRAILLDIVAPGPDGLLLWHAGEAPASWAENGWRLIPHFNRGLPAVRSMVLKRGPVTGLRLFRGRAVLVAGELTGRGGYLGSAGWLSNLYWNAEPVGPQDFLDRWLGARVPHHIALVQGDWTGAVWEALRWCGIPLADRGEGEVWGTSWW